MPLKGTTPTSQKAPSGRQSSSNSGVVTLALSGGGSQQVSNGGTPEPFTFPIRPENFQFDWPARQSVTQCVPLDAEILTREGFKTYDKVTIGDEVLAYDPEKDICIWTPLENITVYENQPTVVLDNKRFSVACNLDHTWIVRRPIRKNGSRVYKHDTVKTCDLSSLSADSCNAIVISAPAEEGNSDLTPDEAAILGWVITDGHFNFRPGNGLTMCIVQSKEENFEEIRNLLSGYFSEYITQAPPRTFPTGKTYATRPSHKFQIRASFGRDLLKKANITTKEDLPKVVTRLSASARKAMLGAMLRAEAHVRKSQTVFGQKNPYVREAFQILATLEGYALGKERKIYEGFTTQSLRHTRVVGLRTLTIKDGPTTDVWCPTTQLGTWIMRYNGAVTITGNTINGAYQDHWGNGIGHIMISGHTGWRAHGQSQDDGFKQFMKLRAIHDKYCQLCGDTRPEDVKLDLVVAVPQGFGHYRVSSDSFKTLKNTQNPLLYRYEIAFTVLSDLGSETNQSSPPQASLFSNNVTTLGKVSDSAAIFTQLSNSFISIADTLRPQQTYQYVVQAGDTLQTVAGSLLGSIKYTNLIQRSNPGQTLDTLIAGTIINIPIIGEFI